jgi:hypothetical protein
VLHPTAGGNWAPVVRVLSRDNQVSLHMENPDTGQPIYRNFMANSSPVVVMA